MANNLTAEQHITKAHVFLMKSPEYCLYSGIFMMGKTIVDDKCPTACTDGYNTTYGRKFVDTLDDLEVRALVLHENLHKAFRHLTTWMPLYKKNPMLANLACDYVINLMIKDSDRKGQYVRLPACGAVNEKYRGMDAGTVFRLLEQDQKDGKGLFDPNKAKGQSGGNGTAEPDGEGMDTHEWGQAQGMTKGEVEAIGREIDQALRQGAILAGKLGANVPREITDALTAKVNWRDALREFITSFCVDKDESTWRRPARRWIAQDIYMPSVIGEAVGRIVIGIDMSGSIGSEEIGQFLGEVKNICEHVKPEAIDLLYWDTDVCAHEKYERDQLDSLLQTTKPRGGGGTRVACVFDFISEHKIKAECVIILSDGYTPWPKEVKYPTIFAITTEVVAPIGKTIKIQ